MYIEPDYEKIAARKLSYSSLKEFAKSPQHFVKYITEPKEITDAMRFGSLIDILLFSPDTAEDVLYVMPKLDRRKKEGKETYDRHLKESEGKIIVDAEKLAEAKFIVKIIRENPESSELLNRCVNVQNKIEWEDSKTGLRLIAVTDADDGREGQLIVDLKSTASADPDDFNRQIFNMDYTLQAGCYRSAMRHKYFKFPGVSWIAVEQKSPFGISVIHADDEMIEFADRYFAMILERFKYCLDNKLFHLSYSFWEARTRLAGSVPPYIKRQMENW